jgi:hypothetical protein
VCRKLTPLKHLSKLPSIKDLNLLKSNGVTCVERNQESDPITEIDGPILASNCDKMCNNCEKYLTKGKVPLFALANGMWLGEVPEQLKSLTYAEQMLIARVQHNHCIVRVSSGMRKMQANAISFANPMSQIYDVLPPPIEELDEVLAFIFTGPCKPTKEDFKRTPMLVRCKKIITALKLNHCDYYDIEISMKNLDSYPENGIPVVVDYRPSNVNKNPESTSVHDMEDEDGPEEGQCPFVVHGITGEEFSTKSLKSIKTYALRHLMSEGKILAVGHSEKPESIYKNPQLFP